MPPNFDYSVRVAVGECNDDSTRTATFTITTYSGVDTNYEIDFDTSTASTDASGTILAGSGVSATETHDYASGGAPFTYEVRLYNAATGFLITTATGVVSIDACCSLTLNAEVDECNADGSRDVMIAITNGGTSDEVITVDYGDGTASAPYTIAAGATDLDSHEYTVSSTTTFTITVTSASCEATADIEVEPCGTCPTVAPVVEIGECEDGMRTVTVTLTVTPSIASQSVAADLRVGSDSVTGSGLAGETLVLVAADSGAAGGTMEYTYEVTSPSECDTGSVTTTVDLPECSETRTCPNIDIDFIERDCAEDCTRKVKTKALISGNPFQALEAELVVNGVVVDTDTGMGTLALADTDVYTSGESISATVHILTPEDCPSYTKTTTVSSCGDDCGEEEVVVVTGDTCSTNPLCCWMCWLMMFFSSSVFFLLAASGAGLWYPYALIIAAVAALLWTPFLIWAYNTSCDDCFISACIVRGILLALLVTIVLVVLSLVGVSVGATTMQLLLMALALAASFSAAYAIYQSGCGYLSLWTW